MKPLMRDFVEPAPMWVLAAATSNGKPAFLSVAANGVMKLPLRQPLKRSTLRYPSRGKAGKRVAESRIPRPVRATEGACDAGQHHKHRAQG